jgi:hypothetical protein
MPDSRPSPGLKIEEVKKRIIIVVPYPDVVQILLGTDHTGHDSASVDPNSQAENRSCSHTHQRATIKEIRKVHAPSLALWRSLKRSKAPCISMANRTMSGAWPAIVSGTPATAM